MEHLTNERFAEIAAGADETEAELEHCAKCDYCVEGCMGGTDPFPDKDWRKNCP